jgi:hypothetical protein
MKLKLLAASLMLAFSGAHAQTTSTWETGEYSRSRTLNLIKASSAYSRGWTGKGSTIAILDSGIDVSLSEFSKKIIAVRDFSNSGNIIDTIGHGTHVAGIAAAAKDGQGMQGVAFDANLIIGKVTSNGIILSSTILSAAQWASTMGADVANMSMNFTLSSSSITPTLIAPGIYKTKFTNTGNLAGGMNATQWASAVPGEMVLVVAAGNDGTPWSGGLSQLATAVDSSGKLLLGGRMIVAGNWNEVSNTGLGPSSNGAATLCQVVLNNVCQDKYKASDFYLLAPGTSIYSTAPTAINKLGYQTMTGTSMAAPVISGGVALVHQMWPQMTGSNIVKLLLVTANKNLPGYNVYTMGQGMMDLDQATRPYGATGIPTTGRLSGAKLASTGPLVVSSGSAGTGKISSVMLVDEFERDFYVNGKFFTGKTSSQPFNVNQLMMAYSSKNAYSLYNNYTDYAKAQSGNVEISLFKENAEHNVDTPTMIEVAYIKQNDDVKMRVSGSAFSEKQTWLGNSLGGFTQAGENKGSTTYTIGFGVSKDFEDGSNVYANLNHGFTKVNAQSDNIKNLGTVMSYSWTAGFEKSLNTNNKFGFMVYQPVTVYHAVADIVAPVGLDENFNIIQNSRGNLAADVHEYRAGFYHKFTSKNVVNTMAFIETRQNYKGQEGVKDTAIGLMISKQF